MLPLQMQKGCFVLLAIQCYVLICLNKMVASTAEMHVFKMYKRVIDRRAGIGQ